MIYVETIKLEEEKKKERKHKTT